MKYICLGILENNLGSDGKPVYQATQFCDFTCAGNNNGRSTHGSTYFYDWVRVNQICHFFSANVTLQYHDTPNSKTYEDTITLNLINDQTGLYDISVFGFFPVNKFNSSKYIAIRRNIILLSVFYWNITIFTLSC